MVVRNLATFIRMNSLKSKLKVKRIPSENREIKSIKFNSNFATSPGNPIN